MLQGKTVILTGAARGLGQSMAIGLAKAHANLVLVSLDAADETVLAIQGSNPKVAFEVLAADIRDAADCQRVAEAALRRFGAIDALVNNAGVGMNVVGSNLTQVLKFTDVSLADWRRIVDTNINGTFAMTRAVIESMLRRGSGRIVNLTSSFATMVRAGFSPYGPSKAAVEAMTAIWAKELAGTGVTVNALLPGGPCDTDMILAIDAPDRSKLLSPSIMIAPVLWLCSDASEGYTGMRVVAKDWTDPPTAASLATQAAW